MHCTSCMCDLFAFWPPFAQTKKGANCNFLPVFCLVCDVPLGMENGRIKDNQITESGYISNRTRVYSPEKGRLNNGALAWSPHTQDTNQWIQITLHEARYSTPVSGIVTQGEYETNSWVKTYKIEYTTDGKLWQYMMGADGQHKVLNTLSCFKLDFSAVCYTAPDSVAHPLPLPLPLPLSLALHNLTIVTKLKHIRILFSFFLILITLCRILNRFAKLSSLSLYYTIYLSLHPFQKLKAVSSQYRLRYPWDELLSIYFG